MRIGAGKTLVGVDIEPGYVAAVQARPGDHLVERAAGAALAPDVVRDGEVVDVAALAAVLKQLFGDHKLSRNVRVGVANQRIVVRTIDLPPITDSKQLASIVRFQAQEHIPMPLEQAVLEHHSLGLVQTPDGPRTRVVLVAARRDMVQRLMESLRQAGLRPQGIDLSAFAMIRALYQPRWTGPVAYVSVSAMTNVAIAEGTTCLFTRTVPLGTESLATELAERQGLTLGHAHGWLQHVGLHTPIAEVDGEESIVLAAREVLSDGVRRIADELRTTIDFHRAQSAGAEISTVVLTGAALLVPGFTDALGAELPMPVEVGAAVAARPGTFADVDASRFAVAAGLAVEEVPA